MSALRIDVPGKGMIQFEGATLPDSIKHFEVAPFFSSMPEEIKTWVLDLRYAWGRERHAPSSLVLRSCDVLESQIHSDREALVAHLRVVFKQADPAEICQEWLTAIQMMRRLAESLETCTWTIAPAEGEVAYFLTQMIRLVQAMETAQQRSVLPPGFVEGIQNATKDEQVRFIIQVTETLSS